VNADHHRQFHRHQRQSFRVQVYRASGSFGSAELVDRFGPGVASQEQYWSARQPKHFGNLISIFRGVIRLGGTPKIAPWTFCGECPGFFCAGAIARTTRRP
jgi:hypothetical protein